MGVTTTIDYKIEVIINIEERWILQVWENNKSCKEATRYLLQCSLWQPEKLPALEITMTSISQAPGAAVCGCPLRPRLAELCCGRGDIPVTFFDSVCSVEFSVLLSFVILLPATCRAALLKVRVATEFWPS